MAITMCPTLGSTTRRICTVRSGGCWSSCDDDGGDSTAAAASYPSQPREEEAPIVGGKDADEQIPSNDDGIVRRFLTIEGITPAGQLMYKF